MTFYFVQSTLQTGQMLLLYSTKYAQIRVGVSSIMIIIFKNNLDYLTWTDKRSVLANG